MDIFSNIDPLTKLLSFGISGFCIALVIMSFRLIQTEQKRDNPRNSILISIYVFMGINFLNLVVVGFLGLPAIGRNDKLQHENFQKQQALDVKDSEIQLVQSVRGLDSIEEKTKSGSLNENDKSKIDNYVMAIDSLALNYAKAGSSKADSVQQIRETLVQQALILTSDTTSLHSKMTAFHKFDKTNSRLTKLVIKPEKLGKEDQ